MKIYRSPILPVSALLLAMGLSATAQVTYTDNFSTPVNYLTNGVVGTIWDGVYLGAGEIANATGVGAAAGSVSAADASISSNSALTIASVQTDWENAADDGVLFFKVITGDFDMSVQVIGPIDTGAYNFPGLMVRAFGANGSPSPNSMENSFLWGRFDEYNIANMRKNNVNGVKTDTELGTYPNANYWLRVNRSGSTFTLYEKATQGAAWNSVGTVTRADFSGVPLQVGIEHSDYGGGATRTAHYANFSVTVSNMGPFAAPPLAATSLVIAGITNTLANLSWTPGAGSDGSLVVMWTGSPVVKEAPANGFTYNGNAGYGLGDTLPATGYNVVYSGPGSSVTVTNLTAGASYNVAVFAYTGSGSATAYTNSPAVGSFTTTSPPLPASPFVTVDPPSPALTNSITLGDWNTNGNFEGWTTAQISGAIVSNAVLSGTASGGDPQLALLSFANGPDLDLAYFDYIEIRLQVPAGFAGNIPLYYGVTNTPGINTSTRVFNIPNASIPQDGAFHVYRLFIGPQVYWRGNLTDIRLDPLGNTAAVGQAFAIDYVRVGDLPGDIYYAAYTANVPGPGTNDPVYHQPVMDLQSKHFRVCWDNWAITNFPGIWNGNIPHGTLRNLEECWKSHVWNMGYREPSRPSGVLTGNKYKVNLTMWNGGYWTGTDGGNGMAWMNITPDGLRVDPPTWVPPHEFTHACQQVQNTNHATVDGQFWENNANYAREQWIYYYAFLFPNQSNLDPNYANMSHFWIGHGRDYYLCWPFWLYLDENPDNLPGLGSSYGAYTTPGFWKGELSGEYLWTTIARLVPGVSVQDFIGYMARRNVTWDYSHRSALQAAYNSGDAELAQRWTYAELRQRPDDPTWWQVPMEFAPQQTGYRIHKLIPQGTGSGRVVTVDFHGLPYTNGVRYADWRASLVVVSDSGAVRYSNLWNAGSNSVTLASNENTLYLVVASTPNQFLAENIDDSVQPYQSHPAKARFQYEVQVFGATPYETPAGSTSGLIQLPLSQGGGWRASTATVDATAYVGPNARVLGTAQVRNNARILDYAIVEGSAQVLNNAVVSGHALVRNSAVVRDNAKVRDYAMVIDNSTVRGGARILQHGEITAGSLIGDWATVKGSASTWHDNTVTTNAQAWMDAVLDGDFSTAQSVTNGFQFGFEEYNPGPLQWITNRTAPRRLYADYEFNVNDSSLAKDYYGVTDGYLRGGPAWVSSDGKRSAFLTFNGTSQYVILDHSLCDLLEISVTVWVKWSGGAPNQPIWFFGSGTTNCMYLTPDDGTGHAKFVIRNPGTPGDQILVASAALPTGVWTHVAVTLSNNVAASPTNLTGRLYVNNVLQQQGSITITPDELLAPNVNTAAQHNYLARGADNSQPYFNGALDSVRVYTGPLSQVEITALAPGNSAPYFTSSVGDQTVSAGVTLAITNPATDPDLPWQSLAYSLPSAPGGATVNTNSGLFLWRPTVAQANTTNFVTVQVSDNGNPSLNATRSFYVRVNPLAPPTLVASLANGQFALRVGGDFGPDYIVQTSTNLTNWSSVSTNNSPTLPFTWTDPNYGVLPASFYRVVLGP